MTRALSSHVDLAATICSLAGAPTHPTETGGVDLSPLFGDASASVRDHVLFAHDSAHTRRVQQTRYAVRGMFDGRLKYARYYGVGGGFPSDVLDGTPTRKLYDVDAAFDDNDHELYDLHEDPARTREPGDGSLAPGGGARLVRPAPGGRGGGVRDLTARGSHLAPT